MTRPHHKNQTARALVTLRERILKGEYLAGTRLKEVALAERLDISRTPIRAALSRLADEGLVERVGARGYQVRSFAPADILDTIELRGLLEGACARTAAERGIEQAEQVGIRALLERMDACFDHPDGLDFEVYSPCNTEFHAWMPRLANRPVYTRELDRVATQPFASPSAFLSAPVSALGFVDDMRYSHRQHWAIFDAIVERQGARAEALLREHCQSAMISFQRFVESGSDIAIDPDFPSFSLVSGND